MHTLLILSKMLNMARLFISLLFHYLLKGTVMQIEKSLINGCLRVQNHPENLPRYDLFAKIP